MLYLVMLSVAPATGVENMAINIYGAAGDMTYKQANGHVYI
jgi:hypothetical protein